MGSTEQEVRQAGGTNISVKRTLNMVFADMSEKQVARLSGKPGVTITIVRDTKLSVAPPTPIPASV